MKKGEHLKGINKIDRKRNLCDTCKHTFPDCDGEPEFGDNVGSDNIIKCKQYRKTEKVYKRVSKGESYWAFNHDFVPIHHIEEESVLDTTRSQNGNYFYTEIDCQLGIDKAKEYQRNKNK